MELQAGRWVIGISPELEVMGNRSQVRSVIALINMCGAIIRQMATKEFPGIPLRGYHCPTVCTC